MVLQSVTHHVAAGKSSEQRKFICHQSPLELPLTTARRSGSEGTKKGELQRFMMPFQDKERARDWIERSSLIVFFCQVRHVVMVLQPEALADQEAAKLAGVE
jgi:hypothetical protein